MKKASLPYGKALTSKIPDIEKPVSVANSQKHVYFLPDSK